MGDTMMKTKSIKKIKRSVTAFLLVFAFLISLAAPFDIVKAIEEEAPATGSEIHAILYYINPNKLDKNGNRDITSNLELVIQRGGAEDPDKEVFKHYTDFAAADSIKPWYRENTAEGKGTVYASYIMKVDIKDKVRPTSLYGWFYYMTNLKSENITHLENIDTSDCTNMTYTFIRCEKLTSLDLSSWDTKKVTTLGNVFNGCYALTNINLSSWELPNATYTAGLFSNCKALEHADISSFNMKKARIIGSMFNNCPELKSVNLGNLKSSGETQLCFMFKGCKSLEEVDLSGWKVSSPGTMMEMFNGCTSLKRVDFGSAENWGKTTRNWTYNGYYERAYEYMFQDCVSLESLDLTCVKGALICGSMFKGCTGLKEVDLSYAGVGRDGSTTASPDLTDKANIFEDCGELSWIKLSADGWPAAGKAGTSMPPKTTWKKIDDPGKDTKLPADELFLNFKSDYAGTWIADSNINFKGNGGSPKFQLVPGNKGFQLDFDEDEVVASRNGYDFKGWYTDEEGGTQIHSGDIPDQWSYYAHWDEHHYTLKLNGNGGTTEKNNETVTEFTAADNLGYDDFYELSNTLFKKEGSVLSSWNTRPNGTGTQYAANDSVDKLTEADGGTVTLYAQWHTPSVTIKFDSHGGSSVEDKHYTIAEGQTVKYGDLSESMKPSDELAPGGYTFLGWFTEETGGVKITSDTQVTESRTLHAHWQKNASVTFDANGGYFDNDTSKTSTTKICKVGRALGVTPEPEHASAVFDGWYTSAEGGSSVDSGTAVSDDIIYYAHWGFKPVFETNGGTFTTYDENKYKLQESSSYTITELPSIQKENSEFLGWYFNGTKLNGGETLDLSEGNIIEARWDDKEKYTITLNYNDGTDKKTNIKVFEDQPIGAFPPVTRTGYDFEGWYPNADGTGDKLNETYTVSSSGNYYAKWSQRNRTLTFDPDGGVMYDESTVKVADGKTIPALPGANRSEYYLDGWFTEKNGEGSELTTDTVITEDKTYYANWKLRTSSEGIYNYSIAWSQNSDSTVTDTGNELVFHPILGDLMSANLFISFAIDSNADSEKQLEAGAVQITFPVSLFKEDGVVKDNNNVEKFNSEKFTYSVVGDNYVFTNSVPLSAGDSIDFTYTCTVSPRNLKGGYIDENGYYRGDYFYTEFEPSIVVNDANDPLNYSRPLAIEVHTKVLTEAGKSRSNVVTEWNSTWGEKPADAEEYFYVIWEMESNGASNSSQKYRYYWSEDTAHDGTVIYSNPPLGTKSAELTSGKYKATVVTKHLKKEVEGELTTIKNEAIHNVEWASGYVEHKRVSATTQVYIPIEGSSGKSLIKTVYAPNDNSFDPYNTKYHYKNGGQEKILAEEEVLLPYRVSYSENTNSNNPAWNNVTEKYKAVKRDYVLTDGMKGDAVISTVTGSASYRWDNPEDKALNDSDYYFDNLIITLEEKDSVCLGDVWSTPELHTNFSDYEDIEVWIRTEGSDTFKLFKTLSGVNTATVDLPEQTVGYQIKHSSEFYCTSINVKADLHLKASNRVLSLVKSDIGAGKATLIKNKASVAMTTVKNNESVTTDFETGEGDGWLSSYELNIGTSSLYAAKACSKKSSSIESNPSASTETMPVMISGWGYNNSGNLKLMKSGVFYDLLPVEFSVDKSSVFVVPLTSNTASRTANSIDADRYQTQKDSTTNNKLSAGYYDVSFTENWQDTGRTLMTITVNVPDSIKATGLDVYYKMTTSYVNLFTNGLNQMNYVAFEDTTEGQSIPSYKENPLSLIDKKYRGAYEALDGKLTAFAQAETHCEIPLVYEHGIRSVVKTEGEYKTKNETVGLNSDYSYFVSYAGSSSAHTRDLVIYDVIENRIGGMESEWYGTFDSVDVSLLKYIDSADPNDGVCAPVIYYSTKAKDDFTTADFNVDNSSIWTTQMPEDKSTITAVAVDCRKTNLQKDFVLAPQKKIDININMVSPSAADRNDKVSYNETYIKATNQELLTPINEVARTSVSLHFTPPDFSKASFPETGTDTAPAEVVKNSVIDYKLNVSNSDDTLTVYNVVVEDTLQTGLSINNKVKVSVGNGDAVEIDKSARISDYSITETGGRAKFTATVKSLAPGESMVITVPATVNLPNETKIMNTAYVTGYNGMSFDSNEYIKSETTYHIVADIKARVKKVNSKDEGLAGAVLEVYEKNNENCDSNGNLKYTTGNNPVPTGSPKTITINGNNVTQFTSTTDVTAFEIEPGDYILHEKSTPSAAYKTAADLPFTIDVEGLAHVNGEMVSVVKMVDQPAYKVVFHENKPDGSIDDKNKVFKIYEPGDLDENKVTHFYDIPDWAGDEYVFAGWYHSAKYKMYSGSTGAANIASNVKTASNFENDTFTKANPDGTANDPDYHLYAKWIPVGTVDKDDNDANLMSGGYRGFGLAGVQIRNPKMYDSNYQKETFGGMRFVTSLKESLLSEIDALSTQKVNTDEGNVDVEYGYCVGTEENINAFTSHYGITDPAKYQIQYKGENVNGKNTTGSERKADTDFRYVTNVNCTRGITNSEGKITDDHRNFTDYRLYTLVVTYEGASASKINQKLAARSYIRYYDANGKLRVFYNTYKKSMFGGCMCSFNQVSDMAIAQNQELLEQQQTQND